MIPAFAALLHLLACLSLGQIVLRFLRMDLRGDVKISAAGYLGSAYALGQGVLGVLLQSVAVAGLFRPAVVVGLFLVLLATVASHWSNWRAIAVRTWGLVTELGRKLPTWLAVLILCSVMMASIAQLSLYPPMEDAQAFYLALPRLIASTHRFSLLPGYLEFAQIGLGSEMHAAAFYSVVGAAGGEFSAELAAKINGVAAVMAICALVWAITGHLGGGRKAQVIALAMVASSSMVSMVVLFSKSDLYPCALGVAALYWAMQSGNLPERKVLCLTGLLTGLAVAAKISYIVIMIPMLGVLVGLRPWPTNLGVSWGSWWGWIRMSITRFGLLGLWALVGLAPLFLKNAVVFGQPLAPFFLFGEEQNIWLNQSWFSAETTLWIAFTYPLALTFGQYPMQLGTVSPLWIAFLPTVFLAPWRNRQDFGDLMIFTASAVIGVVVWVFLRPSVIAPRYYMPALLALLPMAAIAAESSMSARGSWLLRGGVLVGIVFALGMDIRTMQPFKEWARYYVRTTPEGWGRENAIWAAVNALNAEAEPGGRVYLAAYWSLQLRIDLVQCALSKDEKTMVKNVVHDPVKFLETLHRLRVRYIVQDTLTHGDHVPIWDQFQDLPATLRLSRQAFGPDDRMVLYTLLPDEESDPAHVQCVEVEKGIWKVCGSSEGNREVHPK